MQLAQLKEELRKARVLESENKAVLQSLIADFEMVARTGREVDGTALIRKYAANAASNSKLEFQRGEVMKSYAYDREVTFLESLLPTQLTELQLRDLIEDSDATNVGTFMKFLKENYTGQYNGKMASKVARDCL